MKAPVQTNKILIVLPFWEGDRSQAMSLARLLADLEPEHSDYADVLFVARFDQKHDPDTVKYAARRFNVHTYVSQRRGVGWPLGCNSIFFGAMEFIYHKAAAGQIPLYKAVFFMGADTAPLCRGWIEKLSATWDSLNSKKQVYVAGHLIFASPNAGGRDHINGDALLLSGDLKFQKWLVKGVQDVRHNAGWDWALAGEFRRWGWAGIPFIRSEWQRLAPFTQTDWDRQISQGIFIFHGQKDQTLLELARKNLCQKKS
jgi:hypothetical protein